LTQSATSSLPDDPSDDEAPLVDGGAGLDYEVSYSKLKNTDLPGSAAGLAPDIPDLPVAVKALLAPHRQAIAQVVQTSTELQPLGPFLQ
jgi:hypothetical protein